MKKFPKGWCQVTLNEVARYHSGNSNLIKGRLSNNPSKELFPAFSATGQDVWHSEFDQEGSAIIISAVGARCGKCFRADGKWSAIANTHVVWPVKEVIDRDFLWFKINDENFWKKKDGTAQPFVDTRESFKHKKFLLPPFAEQRRIVEKIKNLFARLDKGEEKLCEVRRLLSLHRQSILKEAFAGRLVLQDPNDEHAIKLLDSVLQTHHKNCKGGDESKKFNTLDISDLSKLPEGWVWASFDQLFQSKSNYGKKLPKKQYLSKGKFPVIDQGIAQIGGYSDDFNLVYEGDLPVIIFGDHTRRFKMIRERFICGADGVKIIEPARNLSEDYLFLVLSSAKFTNKGYSRHFKFLQHLIFPLPPLAEQRRIVAKVEMLLAQIDKLEEEINNAQSLIAYCRQSILKKAFRGWLVSQNSNDEPAINTLARIQKTPSVTNKQTQPETK